MMKRIRKIVLFTLAVLAAETLIAAGIYIHLATTEDDPLDSVTITKATMDKMGEAYDKRGEQIEELTNKVIEQQTQIRNLILSRSA
jgi:hypothetical protein